jgi:hypothetical protein
MRRTVRCGASVEPEGGTAGAATGVQTLSRPRDAYRARCGPLQRKPGSNEPISHDGHLSHQSKSSSSKSSSKSARAQTVDRSERSQQHMVFPSELGCLTIEEVGIGFLGRRLVVQRRAVVDIDFHCELEAQSGSHVSCG